MLTVEDEVTMTMCPLGPPGDMGYHSVITAHRMGTAPDAARTAELPSPHSIDRLFGESLLSVAGALCIRNIQPIMPARPGHGALPCKGRAGPIFHKPCGAGEPRAATDIVIRRKAK